MFCGKCGSPIDPNTRLCPNCNSDKSIMGSQETKKKTNFVKIILPIVAIVLIVGIVVSFAIAKSQLRLTDEEKILCANNMENGSYATFDGKYVYHVTSSSNNTDRIYKMELPNGKVKELAEVNFVPKSFYVSGDTVYYETSFASGNINRLTGENTYIEVDGLNDADAFYWQGKCYYFSAEEGRGVFIGDELGKGEMISDMYVGRVFPCGNYLYLFSNVNSFNGVENLHLGTWRMDLDGSNLVKILDYCPRYFVSDGNNLYFTDEDRFLVVSDLNGENQDQKTTRIGNGLNIQNGIIYFEDYNQTGIYKMIDDSIPERIIDGNVIGVIIAGDYIVYYNDEKICAAKIDGTSMSVLGAVGYYSENR